MSRLYFRIYLYFLLILIAFGAIGTVGWLAYTHDDRRLDRIDALGRLVAESLPEDRAGVTRELERLAAGFHVNLALYGPDMTLIASAGTPLPPPPGPAQQRKGWRRTEVGPVLAFRLPDARWLLAHVPWGPRGFVVQLFVALVVLAAVAAWPLAWAITRRLERLRKRADALGAGDLGARVEVEGWDEVAALAASFNRAAARIESLVSVQRTLLASASHELRTPLARIRVAIELLATAPRPELRERIERDVIELDNLIDELLLASRLQITQALEVSEPVDLLALAAEEGARVGAVVTGAARSVFGDRRLLRHLVRNLFENARRHGGGTAIEASVGDGDAGVALRVCDRGPGVPESERERIFDPFHRAAAMREQAAGVGLGLHLVKTIAERHGATVRYRPNEPAGSCFVVRFPPAPNATEGGAVEGPRDGSHGS